MQSHTESAHSHIDCGDAAAAMEAIQSAFHAMERPTHIKIACKRLRHAYADLMTDARGEIAEVPIIMKALDKIIVLIGYQNALGAMVVMDTLVEMCHLYWESHA